MEKNFIEIYSALNRRQKGEIRRLLAKGTLCDSSTLHRWSRGTAMPKRLLRGKISAITEKYLKTQGVEIEGKLNAENLFPKIKKDGND